MPGHIRLRDCQTQEENTTQTISVAPENAELQVKSGNFACGVGEGRSADYGFELPRNGRLGFSPMSGAYYDTRDHCCRGVRAAGRRELGRAA